MTEHRLLKLTVTAKQFVVVLLKKRQPLTNISINSCNMAVELLESTITQMVHPLLDAFLTSDEERIGWFLDNFND
jgi:hypothetical protein